MGGHIDLEGVRRLETVAHYFFLRRCRPLQEGQRSPHANDFASSVASVADHRRNGRIIEHVEPVDPSKAPAGSPLPWVPRPRPRRHLATSPPRDMAASRRERELYCQTTYFLGLRDAVGQWPTRIDDVGFAPAAAGF